MMKLLKRIALVSLFVLALSGCTKSSVSVNVTETSAVVEAAGTENVEVVVDKTMFLTKETDPYAFDWEQIKDDAEDMFMDDDFYPLGSEMSYEGNIDKKSIKLMWKLKNEATEEDAMEYAVELVQQFNNIMAVQKEEYAFASSESFGGIWDVFELSVQILKEDGTVMIEKTYAAGEAIDLQLPTIGENGPKGPQSVAEEAVRPSAK